MVKSMADKPIIFAMANPDPEITPEEVAEVRPDAIVATGRSDYPNQINNVLGFPFIFRGALDVQASTINEAMKIAAAKALAELAREDVPDQVAAAFLGRQVKYGPDYIIPAPFDPRLISHVLARRRQGGDGDAAWRAGRSSTWRATWPSSPAGSIRSPAGCTASSPRCAMRPSASSLPRASSRRSRAPPTPSTTPASGARS